MKENCSPSYNQQPKKQVRFNTSLKMASSPSDHQFPRPLTDIQNTKAERRQNEQHLLLKQCETYEPTFHSNAVIKNKPNPIAYFDKDCVINLPSKRIYPDSKLKATSGQNVAFPKPSDELDLSILDSSDVFKGKGHDNNDKINGLSGKMYENDTPYCFSPSKMPLQSVYNQTQSEKLFNLTPGLMSSAAQSKKDFRIDKPDSNPGLDFFTLPNSAGLYQDKKSTATPGDNVAAAKINLMNQKANHYEPNFGDKRDFNVDSRTSGVLRQFAADKSNVGFLSQAQNNNNRFNKQERNANGISSQGQSAYGFISQAHNANGFTPHGQNVHGFGSQEQNVHSFGLQRQNVHDFGSQQQNVDGFSTERQNVHGFGTQLQNVQGFGSQQQNVNFGAQRQNVHDFGSQQQNVFSSDGHIQSCGANSHGSKINYTQVNHRENNVQYTKKPTNHNMIQTEFHQNYEQCLQNDPNDYCCPRNVNTRRPCCTQRDCHPHYEETIMNKAGIITNGLEMKQKAIEARENHAKRGQNILKDIEKCNNDKENVLVCSKNTDEPTVSDLYEIIKLQNKQLQMLQNRVDRLLTVNEAKMNDQFELPDARKKQVLTKGQSDTNLPQADVNVNCIEHISIGVMTSFELVMSSNYVNKRNVTFNPEAINNQDNRRDECVQTTPNKSNSILLQINNETSPNPISESGGNFLDGIARCNKTCDSNSSASKTPKKLGDERRKPGVIDDTEQIDDQVTPKMNDLHRKARTLVQRSDTSPIAEYNEECFDETEPNECSQPNVGWTFYNNVMSRVNNMLSPPTSDTNDTSPNVLSRRRIATEPRHQVTGPQRLIYDTPRDAAIHQFSRPSSEVSLHMTQLAAKYNVASKAVHAYSRAAPTTAQPQTYANTYRGDARNEMSFATMQYMQRYQLLSVSNEQPQVAVAVDRGNANYANHHPRTHLNPVYNNPSRILDITTLKQQSKLL